MEITIRNITKDTMLDFKNDHTITLPMETDELRDFLGDDEWIVIDFPIGEEMIDILQLNDLVNFYGEKTLRILAKSYLLDEIMEMSFIIVDFNEETSKYNEGQGVYPDDWWKGYVLHKLGYMDFPFEYKSEMEGYVKFEQLWYTAESWNWREIKYKGNAYLVKGE